MTTALSLAPGDTAVYARHPQQQDASGGQAAPAIPNDQLDSLVAPVALYPDPLLTQVLVASTYPLEIIQLQQWIQKNNGLKGDDLTNAVQKQNWDPSIQAMAVFPDLVKRLADDIKWTTDLGNRLPCTAVRRDGRCATHAYEGEGCGEFEAH